MLTKDVANDYEWHAGLEEVHRLGVTHRVGPERLRQHGIRRSRRRGVARDNASNARPRQAMTESALEQRFVDAVGRVETVLSEMLVQ